MSFLLSLSNTPPRPSSSSTRSCSRVFLTSPRLPARRKKFFEIIESQMASMRLNMRMVLCFSIYYFMYTCTHMYRKHSLTCTHFCLCVQNIRTLRHDHPRTHNRINAKYTPTIIEPSGIDETQHENGILFFTHTKTRALRKHAQS